MNNTNDKGRRFQPKIVAKRWDHNLEPEIFEAWQREGIHSFRLRDHRKIFVIDTPPPYPSGAWHIGAVAHYSQIDMIARSARMLGYNVLFPIGIDRNGLPVELYTESLHKVKMRDLPRERFLELCKTALDGLEDEMIKVLKGIGESCGYEEKYRTDSEGYRKLTQRTFIELWRRGLIYEATYPTNYCYECGTTIADAEVEYKELPTSLVHINFNVKETDETLTIATTRPELLCSCQLVIVHPEDERYRHLHGKHAVIPVYDREVEVRPHPTAKPEFGTGAVMVCSYGDYTDVLLFRELKLKEIIAIDEDGRLTEAAGRYRNFNVTDARTQIVQDLRSAGFVKKIDHISHRTPSCSRSGTPIEIIPMREYYLKQLDLLDDLKRLAKRIDFHPEEHRNILMDWMNSVTIDWPISRRRVYATEIPIWYCKQCGRPYVPPPGAYYRPWRDKPPVEKCAHCGSREFVGDTRTFDTWMDSSITPLFITGYQRDKRLFEKFYPTTIRPQGKDIVRTWLYYTLLRCYQLTGKAPFREAWIGGLGMDEQGVAMHKSRGNVIDPAPILRKYGADAFRFWNASESTQGSDYRCSEMRISGAHKFITKLWNISRFISAFPQPHKAKLMPSDKWILSELRTVIERSVKGYRDLNFYVPANEVRGLIWETFASHYMELVKARAYGQGSSTEEQRAAWYTLHTVLKSLLLLLAPITPFITDKVWRELYSKRSIHSERFPKAAWKGNYRRYTETLMNFNREVWKIKEERKLTLRDPLEMTIPQQLKAFRADLIRMHSLETPN